jgi:succinate dehydrogenase / fumarate reductase, iron-sulfur subunit
MSSAVATAVSSQTASATQGTVRLRIRRQDGPGLAPYWQDFEVPFTPAMNVLTALNEIRKLGRSASGQSVSAPVWEASCLEEVCGACSMRINGKPRQACSALVEQLAQPIVVEPMDTFPVVRDLIVDRERMFGALKRVKAWVPIDGTHDLGPGPRQSPADQGWMYVLSRCMSCGCCVDACPQATPGNDFVGPAAISQARLFNAHPTGALHKGARLAALLDPGGIAMCGNAQACVKVCPKEIPLTQSISEVGAQTMRFAMGRFFSKPDVEM